MHSRAECLEETDSLFKNAFDCYLSGPQETSQFIDWEWGKSIAEKYLQYTMQEKEWVR